MSYNDKKCFKESISERLITDEICGKFRLNCNSESKILWQAIGIQPSGSIKVINTSNCKMILIIKRGENLCNINIPLMPKDEIILTVTLIERISVKCTACEYNEICTGCFEIGIHYPFICSLEEIAKDNTCFDADYTFENHFQEEYSYEME